MLGIVWRVLRLSMLPDACRHSWGESDLATVYHKQREAVLGSQRHHSHRVPALLCGYHGLHKVAPPALILSVWHAWILRLRVGPVTRTSHDPGASESAYVTSMSGREEGQLIGGLLWDFSSVMQEAECCRLALI